MTNIFAADGVWLKGNLHTHTTESDGAYSPAENVHWHEEHDYDFVAITDHDRLTDPHRFCDPQLVTLLGTELSLGMTTGDGPFHLVAFGLPQDFVPPKANSLAPQAGIELVNASGGLCFVAHPHWSSTPMEELAACQGFAGVEIFNMGCEWENRTGTADTYWDDLLRRGRSVWGFATDDSHWRYPDHGGGWIVVRAAERSAEAILAAIKSGQFYASRGPQIEAIEFDGTTLRVQTSPVESIYWTEGRRGWSLHATDEQGITEAEFVVKARRYFRVMAVDGDGRVAWSNPVFVGSEPA
jgi:hypothetical protein